MTTPPFNDDARAVAHDLNNLLAAIIGAADAVLERTSLDPETRTDVLHIREGARRGTALVSRLRGDATAPPGVISINGTIRAASGLLAHGLGPGFTLTLMLTEPDAMMTMDPGAIDRVLLNLIVNARHAMAEGGTVTLSTESRMLAEPRPHVPDTVPAGHYVVIGVADTGTGMPQNQLPGIFERGFTTRSHSGGSGLGLASVRDLVHQSGGYLTVDSVEGHGTRFEIYLPRFGGETAEPPPPDIAASPRTVLLVEDDALVSRIAERLLRRAGWTVLAADSAGNALEILKESACDLMISDVAMPGMDGVALTRLVLTRWPDLPVILTSGYERAAVDDGLQNANVEFLTKPYSRDDLLAAVERIVPAP
jgi:two-component system cell cycle sensor histidine kinase/response regulator CckA